MGFNYGYLEEWWVLDHPYARKPRATSALEAVIWSGARLAEFAVTGRLTVPEWKLTQASWRSAARFVLRNCSEVKVSFAVAELRCEAKRITAAWAAGPRRVPKVTTLPERTYTSHVEWIREEAREEAITALPYGWVKMTDPERLEAMGEVAVTVGQIETRSDAPVWKDRSLTCGGIMLKKFTHSADCQTAILDAFQSLGWAARAEPFLEAGKRLDGDNLRNAVDHLNKGLSSPLIHFRSGGDGRSVEWRYGPKRG